MSEDVTIAAAPADSGYEIYLDGRRVGLADYSDDGGVRNFHHTETDPAAQGQGLAGRLIRFALDDTRSQGLRVIPSCSFVCRFLTEHPEDLDLVEPSVRRRFSLPDPPA